MGRVYLARDRELRRIVAIKLLAPELAQDAEFRRRFEQEAWAAAGIQHGNVVQVYDVGETSGAPPIPFLVLQYVEGVSLGRFLEDHPRLPERRSRRLLRDIAAGLAAAHQRDLVHRDIKPANILIEHGSGRAYVADFGISAALSPRAIGGAEPLEEHGMLYGTPPYMSPEQTLGAALGPPSDIYSLGILAFEVVSGTLPFHSHSPSGYMGAQRTQPPQPLRERRQGLSEELVRLIERCLEKDPRARPSASDLARELVPSAEDEILWPPPGLTALPRFGRRIRRTATLAVISFVVLLIALALRLPGIHTAAGWWNAWAGGSVVAATPAAAPGAGPVVVWQGVILLGALALAAGIGGTLVQSILAGPRLRELRSRGWHRETIADALADPDGRTGLLLAGVREFGSVDPRERDRIRRFRRVGHWALLVAVGWAAIALCTWALSVLAGVPLQPSGGPPIGPAGLILGLGPVALAMGVTGNALFHERRAGGKGWRRPHSGTFTVPTDEEGGEVAGWYADLPGDQAPDRIDSRATRSRLPAIAAQLVAGGLLVWTVVALGLLVISILLAGRFARRLGPDTARVAGFVENRDRGRTLDSVRQVLDAYEPTRADGLSAPGNLLATLSEGAAGAPPPYLVEPRRVLGSLRSELAPTTLVASAIRRARDLPADTLKLLQDLADHPRTRLLRSAAGQSSVSVTGDMSFIDLRTALEANAAGAILATARGGLVLARARLGENARVAEAALVAPGRLWPETGLRMLQALVLLPLAEIEHLDGKATQEATLRAAAQVIAETLDQFGPSWLVGSIGLASDPRDLGAVRRLVADSTIPEGFRAGALESTADAACLNPREWLAGPDGSRIGGLGGRLPIAEIFRTRGIGQVLRRIRYCAGLGGS